MVHPMDLESFGWTSGGIVHVDGAMLNEPRELSQKILTFMHVDSLPPNPNDKPNREEGESPSKLLYPK